MSIGYTGTPTRGYDVSGLIARIGQFLDAPEGQGVALAGVGHLGQAIMAYFAGRRPHLAIVAAFDKDPQKVDRVIHGCPCYPVERMEEIVREQRIRVGIIAVPAPAAQATANTLVRAGVRGLLNFAPARLHVPVDTYVQDADIAVFLEKVAFFASHGTRVPYPVFGQLVTCVTTQGCLKPRGSCAEASDFGLAADRQWLQTVCGQDQDA